MYDAIIVGARCAGSPTALLLARLGHKVLLVDRATFPSDMPFSTHFVHQAGSAALQRWGLLDRLAATNCPPITHDYFDYGDFSLSGPVPAVDGVSTAFAPRRLALDSLLVQAAAEAGAEVREGFAVQELLWEDDRVVGLRGRHRDATITERARIVVGADGMSSAVARTVKAPEYRTVPPLEAGYYAYWSGLPMQGWHLWLRPNRVIFSYNTNDDLTLVGVAFSIQDVEAIRGDIERHHTATIEQHAPELAERMRRGRRESRYVGGAVGSHIRRPHGPGWALVGDAGYQKDPCTASGITDSFLGAEWLVEAIDAGLRGHRRMDESLSAYEERRNRSELPYFELTTQLATLAPPPAEMVEILRALRDDEEQRTRFFGVLAKAVRVEHFFAPENIEKLLGKRRERTASA